MCKFLCWFSIFKWAKRNSRHIIISTNISAVFSIKNALSLKFCSSFSKPALVVWSPLRYHIHFRIHLSISGPLWSAGKESTCNVGDLGSIPGLGISPGEGKSYPLQYSGLKNSMDYIVHGVTESWTWLSNCHFSLSLCQFLQNYWYFVESTLNE